MDTKNNLETAAGCQSLATNISPIKNKESFSWFDDTMPNVDDWMDYDVDDEDKSEENQSLSAELTAEAEVPPKDDRASSAVSLASPKNKKRKFPNFDEILQNLNFDTLTLKFTKLLMFLKSDNKELALPFSTKEYEEFFITIVKDINVLKSKSLDAHYRHICDQILRAATGYLLIYTYEYKTEFQKIVMVIRKEKNHLMAQSEAKTSSFSWSEECTKSSSQTSNNTDNKKLSRTISPSTISIGFKLHCLRTMLAFIKYDETKSMEFPELSPDQAHYVQSLLRYSSGEFNDFESHVGVKDLHRVLWEAMKMNSLKYEFRITCEDSCAGKKNMTFEKIPKQKSGTDLDSNQIMNPTTEFQISEIQKSENPKSENPKPEDPKSEIEKPESPMPDVAKPWFAKPEVPNFVPVQKIPRITKKMLNKRIKLENETLFVKRLPAQFVTDTLNTIIEFLLDDEQQKLVLVPKTPTELEFHRKVINWCKAGYSVSKFGEEFEKLHHTIQSLLPRFNIKATKGSANKYNETTGIKEMTYIKVAPKHRRYVPDSVQSAPKKKKVNLQNVLELAGTEQIQLASVVDLNQSLRNKKKNKKQKKAKLSKANAVASNVASAKASNKGHVSAEDSSSACSSRAASWDRSKGPRSQHMSRRPTKENRREDMARKEQLIEALSVPVQSDKAMRMMRGMGWSGGALGTRGDGITEPLMPKLDLPSGAGFGHSRISLPQTIAKRPKETITTTSWVSENGTAIQEIENKMTLKKTKELLLENSTFVSMKKTDEQQLNRSGSNVELSKPSGSNVDLSKSSGSNVELPTQSKSNVELSTQSKSNVELPTQLKSNVELPKPETPFTSLSIPKDFARQAYLHSIFELLNSDATYKTIKYQNVIPVKARKFVIKAVQVINDRKVNYGIFQSDEFSIYTQIYVKCKKSPQIFVDAAFLYDFKTIELKKTPPDRSLPAKLNMPSESVPRQPDLPIGSTETNAEIITEEMINSYIISTDSPFSSRKAFAQLKFKVLFLLNILNFVKSLNEEVEVTFNKILSLKEKAYIQNVMDEVNMRIKFGSSPAETKLCSEIKEHVKDAFLGVMFDHQYTVVTLNKYFRFKRLNRPDNAVKRKCQTTVNLDIYTSETVSQAKVNIHEPTVRENNNKVVENFNFADDVAKSNDKLDEYDKKDSEIKSTVYCSNVAENNNTFANIHEPTVRENNNKVVENFNFADDVAKSNDNLDEYDKKDSEIKSTVYCSNVAENNNTFAKNEELFLESSDDDITNPYDSDVSSVDEYDNNNASAKVPKLFPGEESVNISNFLCYYDKEKPNTHVKNNIENDSASNVTENINNKNNIGNGNVVIDNNDNQIIDMKRDGNCKTSDVRMDEIESDFDSDDVDYYVCVEMSVDIGKEEEVNITDNEGAGLNEQPIEHSDIAATNDGRPVNQHENIGVANFDIDEDLLNTNDSDIADFNSHSDCWQDIATDEINDIPENLFKNKDVKDQNVIMKENVTEMMEVISINDKEEERRDFNYYSDCWRDIATDEINDIPENLYKNKDIKDQNVIMKENFTEIMEVISITDKEDLVEVTNVENRVEIAKSNNEISNQSDEQNVKQETINLDTKADCDKLKKVNIVLSGKKCDTQSVILKVGTEINVHDSFHDMDSEIKTVRIVHNCHPLAKLTKEKVTEIQKFISNAIMLTIELPLLKCDGIQDGALVYTCHNKKTYDWLQNTISIASCVKVLNTEKITKMALKFYCFFDYNSSLYLFKMIELYNRELSTKNWVVEKTEKVGDYVIFIVKMDKFSINFIQESGLSLFAGVDKVQFSPIWE